MRDRFAPERILRLMAAIWNSTGPVFAGCGEAAPDIRTKLADDLFRLGNTLGQLNVIGLAGEHHAESFRLLPSAESATLLARSYSETSDRDSALAWCRRAIETDATLGNPWNDIGALLLENGELKEAVPWLSTATQAPRYDAQGFPWLNLARVHEKLGNKMAAFEAAREALEHLPEDKDALRIFEESGAGLI
jgi:tetratricopeptide (TPR) repeat protein